ncbi:MAG: RnfABCDGE type electron transport complex subunit D [Paludibacteraceae bacterium]|nr:RnfABCDGE type electron transport complex subunit D [Paludibacteraceae bacterium]
MSQLITSAAPHVHSGDSVQKNMLLVILALLPAFVVSMIAFGWSALITTCISIATCVLTEWCITKFMLKQQPSLLDLSAVLTGLLLAFNLPSNLPWWMVVLGSVFAIGIGKMVFGGLGQNVFNPALVGRVFLLISFPAAMTTWPVAKGFATRYLDAETAATPLSYMKNAIADHQQFELDSLLDSFLSCVPEHIMGGSLGEISALALLIGGLFLICMRVISWHIPVAILATIAAFTGILSACGIGSGPLTHLLTGGVMLGAIFMATDYVTSPMTAWGKIIYGIGIGIIVVVIRTWGSYPEGMSFAILIMNGCVPLLNRIAPKRFGEVAKK